MALGDAYLEKTDAVLVDLFAAWNIYTTIFATILFFYFAYPWLTWRDPDVHPFLLARQAAPSPVRQPGESAVYRSIEIPYGYPLRAGLGVKDPGAPKWSSGRNGDIRDIWRQAARGPLKDDGSSAGPKSKLYTVLGREKIIEHDLDSVTREINVIGKYMSGAGGQSVVICLSNSVELLASVFAAVFYGLRPTLVPHGIAPEALTSLLSKTGPDFLIAEAGSLNLESTSTACPNLSHVIWVTKGGSQHMDWTEIPAGAGSKVEVSAWREIIDQPATSSDLPTFNKDSKAPSLSTFWPSNDGGFELVEYTSANIISAVAALNAAGARNHRLSPDDLVLPIASLAFCYPLCVTFAALFSNASVALNSVAGEDVDFESAISGLSPTVVVASSKTVSEFHDKLTAMSGGVLGKLRDYSTKQSLQAGNMPSQKPRSLRGRLGVSLSKLRLLMVYHRAGAADSPRISASNLTDIRVSLGVRISYALTTAAVAGAVSQTNILDYRDKGGNAHFGPPLSSVEICLKGEEEAMSKDDPQGKILVRGPAVIVGEASLELVAQISEDNTLLLV